MAENASGAVTSRYMTRNRKKALSKAEAEETTATTTGRRALSNISNVNNAPTGKNAKAGVTKKVVAKRAAKKVVQDTKEEVKARRSSKVSKQANSNLTRANTRKRSKPPAVDENTDNIIKKRSKNSMEVDEMLDVVDLTDDDRMSIDTVAEPVVEDYDIAALVQAIDAIDMKDSFTMGEFAQDIHLQERAEEQMSRANPNYMETQTEITSRMREKLIDWIIEVHNKFQLEPETLFLGCNTLDRFLAVYDVPKSKLQLVGCVALLLASKYEEIYPPVGQDFVYISANAFTKEQLFHMETVVLNKLKFDMTVPSSLHFSHRFLKICGVAEGKDVNTSVRQHLSYILESTLQSYAFLNFPSSLIAHCATYIALRVAYASNNLTGDVTTRTPVQTLHLLCQYTRYTKEDMLPCMEAFRTLLLTEPRYLAVRRKFKNEEKWNAVQTLDVTNVFDAMVNMDPAEAPMCTESV